MESDPGLDRPDMQTFMVEAPYASPEVAPQPLPPHCWSLTSAILRTASRGRLRLTGADPSDPVMIEAASLEDQADIRRLRQCLDFCRMIGNSRALRPFARREILPATEDDAGLAAFMRNALVSHSHETCTAKMGRDPAAVVDHRLRVYGIDALRIADGSILPRVPAGNTMAPCVVIGERAGDMIKADHGI